MRTYSISTGTHSGGGGFLDEQSKAASIPVANAVIVLPLSQTVTNYGTLGGGLIGTPPSLSITDGGTFDGINDYGYIVTGSPVEFTCVYKGSVAANGGDKCPVSLVAASTTADNIGLGVERFGDLWNLLVFGALRAVGTVAADSNVHTFVVVRTATASSLWVDGVLSATWTAPLSKSDSLVLGARHNTGAWANFCACKIKNLALYHSVLSGAEITELESWVNE